MRPAVLSRGQIPRHCPDCSLRGDLRANGRGPVLVSKLAAHGAACWGRDNVVCVLRPNDRVGGGR